MAVIRKFFLLLVVPVFTITVWWSIKNVRAKKNQKKRERKNLYQFQARRFKKASWAVPGNKYLFALRFVLIFILFVYCLTSCKSISLTIYIQRFEDIATDLFVWLLGMLKFLVFTTQKCITPLNRNKFGWYYQAHEGF